MRAATAYTLRVNGKQHVVTGEGHTPLIYFLRNDLALNSPKFGCGLGECGACTVIIDGEAARSCAFPLRLAEKKDIVTLEGLGNADAPHPIQQAFVDAQAAQCGYCISGMIMTAKAFLDTHPAPDDAAIRGRGAPAGDRTGVWLLAASVMHLWRLGPGVERRGAARIVAHPGGPSGLREQFCDLRQSGR